MIRIRRIYDDVLPIDQQGIAQVQEILRQQFPLIPVREIDKLPGTMRDPLKHRFRSILFVALGLDTAKNDPTGTWALLARDFERLGRRIGARKRHTLVVQEGGYNNRNLGVNARHFFAGLWSGAFSSAS